MFFSVIAAYVLAAVFAFCGVVNTVGYVMEAQREMGYSLFIEGLVVELWPFAVSVILILLTQIACKLERWMLLWTMAQGSAPRSAPTKPTPSAPRPAAAPVPAGPVVPVTPPVMQDAPPAPQPPPAPSRPEAGQTAIPLPPKPAPVQGKQAATGQEGLNFFKLD